MGGAAATTLIEGTSGRRGAFALVASLFFAWGFITANNDPLLVALKQLYSLSYVEALLTHFMFAIAFGLVSLPAAELCGRIGFARSVPVALGLMITGCAMVAMLAGAASYAVVLACLFVLASGVVLLQVASNPLAATLGEPGRSHWRLNVAQSLNSLGVVIGGNAGAALMLAPLADRPSDPAAIRTAYALMAGLVVLVACGYLVRMRSLEAAAPRAERPSHPFAAFRSRPALFGAVALGLYVGAEVTLSSLMVGFLHQPSILGTSFEAGGQLLANLYWGGALAGRLAGIVLLGRISAPRLLAGCAIGAVLLCATATLAGGPVAGFAALAVGLMNSIMFPTIFSITLESAKLPAAATSGLLCAAIVCGAMLPLAAARLADVSSLSTALILPLAAYLFILFYARIAARSDR